MAEMSLFFCGQCEVKLEVLLAPGPTDTFECPGCKVNYPQCPKCGLIDDEMSGLKFMSGETGCPGCGHSYKWSGFDPVAIEKMNFEGSDDDEEDSIPGLSDQDEFDDESNS